MPKEINEQISIITSLFSYDLSSISTSWDIVGEMILNLGEGSILNTVEIASMNCLGDLVLLLDGSLIQTNRVFSYSLLVIGTELQLNSSVNINLTWFNVEFGTRFSFWGCNIR